MNRINSYLYLFIVLITFILLHEPILIMISNVSSIFKENNNIKLDNEAYKLKIKNLEIQLAEYEKNYENLKILSSSSYVKSKLALRNIYDFYDFIIINTDTLVKEGSAVINEKGLIGIVNSVDGNTAKVILTTAGSISVKVNNSFGLLNEYDKKNKQFIIHNINNYEDIRKGDEVVTSGLSKIDGNIKIGKVKKVDIKGIEKLVYVEPYVNYDTINYVYVINK